jgi:peptidoglycan-associated lipoprotein
LPDTTPTVQADPTGFPQSDQDAYHKLVASGKFDRDTTKFAAETVYFDTDSATVKKSEQEKLQHVADAMKGDPAGVLEIEGHCDDRGTEGYNLALGNKRGLALREYLANLGVDAGHIGVVSFGEAKPAVKGNNEEAWKKNRRGVFVVLVPKQ